MAVQRVSERTDVPSNKAAFTSQLLFIGVAGERVGGSSFQYIPVKHLRAQT